MPASNPPSPSPESHDHHAAPDTHHGRAHCPRLAGDAAPPVMPDGSVVDRRAVPDRRKLMDRLRPDEAKSGLERRRGPGRRLSDFQRSAEEGELTTEQFLFVIAIDEFKKANNKTFPSWTDVLEVIRLLGYRKTKSSELSLLRAEDWLESADAPAQVRPDRWQERFRAPPASEAA